MLNYILEVLLWTMAFYSVFVIIINIIHRKKKKRKKLHYSKNSEYKLTLLGKSDIIEKYLMRSYKNKK